MPNVLSAAPAFPHNDVVSVAGAVPAAFVELNVYFRGQRARTCRNAWQQRIMQRRIPCEAATGSSPVGLWRCPAASRAGRRLRLADERKGQQLQQGQSSG